MAGRVETLLGEGRLEALRAAAPSLRGLALDAVATPLGGLSNLNLRLDAPDGPLVLRIAKPNDGPFLVDRAEEARMARIAGERGIGPELLYADADGMMLTRLVDACPMSAGAFRVDPDAVRRAGLALRRLHGLPLTLERRFDAFAIMEAYRRVHAAANGPKPAFSPALEAALAAARERLKATAVPLVPSHCDPVPENFLDSGDRMMLVDWEYARMNDPAWDLAYLSVEGRFGAVQDAALIGSYGDPAVGLARLHVLKLAVCALNAAWGFIQPSPDAALATWRDERLALAHQLAGDPRFGASLAAIRLQALTPAASGRAPGSAP